MTEPLAPPYAADTRAKGWRFELDYEKIEQSNTWSIAAEVPMAQPALLMMWLVSWTQVPCGSFPSDENVIRAKCRISARQWQALRPILMRGWVQAGDGRLYHQTITERVLEMLDYRKKTADRVAKFKLARREQRDANALLTPEVRVSNATGTGTGTIEEKEKEKGTRKRALPPEKPEGVGDQTWTDWLDLRAKKRAPVTPTVLAGAEREAQKASMSLDAFLRVWCLRGSQGLEAGWIRADERRSVQPASFRAQDVAAKAARYDEMSGGLVGAKQTATVIEMEVPDAPRLTRR